MERYVNMHPVKQLFDVLNHLKATDGLKKIGLSEPLIAAENTKFSSFIPSNTSVYIMW